MNKPKKFSNAMQILMLGIMDYKLRAAKYKIFKELQPELKDVPNQYEAANIGIAHNENIVKEIEEAIAILQKQ